jgi:ketosteroid isomerase-like protein
LFNLKEESMKHPSLALIAVAFLLLPLGAGLTADKAMGQESPQATVDIDAINAAGQAFIAAIGARDISAMEKLWAHEPYAAFIGPLSTTIVVGWDGVRKAWQMRFSQFDRVTISLAESHIRTNGNAAWVVGIEKVELLGKDGRTSAHETVGQGIKASSSSKAEGIVADNCKNRSRPRRTTAVHYEREIT